MKEYKILGNVETFAEIKVLEPIDVILIGCSLVQRNNGFLSGMNFRYKYTIIYRLFLYALFEMIENYEKILVRHIHKKMRDNYHKYIDRIIFRMQDCPVWNASPEDQKKIIEKWRNFDPNKMYTSDIYSAIAHLEGVLVSFRENYYDRGMRTKTYFLLKLGKELHDFVKMGYVF